MRLRYLFVALSLLISTASSTHAVDLLNATWVSSGSVTTSGSGTLSGSTISVTTVAVANGGVTTGQNWATVNFISNAGLTNISPAGSIDLAFKGNATSAQTVTFSGAGVTNPYILINWTEAGDTIDFGSNTPTLIAANNAQLVGNTLTSTGATNTGNDGFVVQFTGTFTNLSFNVVRSGAADSISYSVAVAVPEPSTYLFGAISACSLALLRSRRGTFRRQS